MKVLANLMMLCLSIFLIAGCSSQSFFEEELMLGENTPFELGATLTLPRESEDRVPAVVLVHGSGPSDRNQTVHSYQIFKDLAHGLAEQGMAVLRYDKRTYVYGEESIDDPSTFSVNEETVEDAVKAGEWLKNDARIDTENIYLIGHSQGGMLAPRIYDASGDFAGIVIMAGSPRPLWEIIIDQNMALLETLDPESTVYQTSKEQVNVEREKANKLSEMTAEEAKEELIFGLPAYYFYEMDRFDTENYLMRADFPILAIHGETDFQVDLERDFKAYQELLVNNEQATFKTYPNLNHFFIESQGDMIGTIEEYQIEAEIDQAVIETIADWIKAIEMNTVEE